MDRIKGSHRWYRFGEVHFAPVYMGTVVTPVCVHTIIIHCSYASAAGLAGPECDTFGAFKTRTSSIVFHFEVRKEVWSE